MSVSFKQLGELGRTGNQLFQIAAAIGLANKHKDTAVFPYWEYSKYFKNTINQSLDSSKRVDYHEQSFCYTDIPYQDNLNLTGFFQSEKYFYHCADLIRKYFEPSDEMLAKIKTRKLNKTCSIHVRRGDYLKNPLHELCTETYYTNAIDYIRKNTNTKNFMVFSDDIAWCKSFFPSDFIFSEDTSDIEDLFLMSRCSHNIIANSSFSWWGAWLNKSKSKVVVAPDRWFANDERDTKDVIPDSWIKIDAKNASKKDVGLLVIATGRYDVFVPPLLESARRHFCTNQNVTFFVFTDSKMDFGANVVKISKKHEPFPLPTLLRYNTFVNSEDKLSNMDYLFYCDADMLFVDTVGDEILSDITATIHPGYNGRRGTPETRPESTAYISETTKMTYFCGGFNGGSSEQFLKMSRAIDNNIKKDYQRGIIAIWHDESHINHYLVDNPPTKVLDSGYCYGEDMTLPYTKRLVALTKEKSFVTEKQTSEQDILSRLKPSERSKYAVIFYHKNISELYESEWVDQCVNSIKDQSFKDFDVFELNYGEDNYMYAANAGVSHYFYNQPMENHIFAMNFLITEVFSKGYLAVFNTNMDDWFSQDRLEKQIKELNNYDLISSNFYHSSDTLKKMDMASYGDIKIQLDKKHNIIAHPVICINKTFWDDDLHYNNLIGYEDLDLWQRAINKGKKFKILDDYLLYYRLHDNQIVSGNTPGSRPKSIAKAVPKITTQEKLDAYAQSLYYDFTNNNRYLRNGCVERAEIDRHLSGCTEEFTYEQIGEGEYMSIRISSGGKTSTTDKFRYA